MNQPPQIGSRVQWWDARGKLKHGSVRAINVLSDNSHIIVIKVEDGQPAIVTLPRDCNMTHSWHNSSSVRMTCGSAENHDVNACRMSRDYNGRGLGRGVLEKWRDHVQLDANAVNATILRSHLTSKHEEIRQLNVAAELGITDSLKYKIRVHGYELSHDGSLQKGIDGVPVYGHWEACTPLRRCLTRGSILICDENRNEWQETSIGKDRQGLADPGNPRQGHVIQWLDPRPTLRRSSSNGLGVAGNGRRAC
ncbi:hypothetical protein EDB85DRAFT_1889095 [Lactarius pseudohatsudake]|nr:hypothetical protein EDB85DRAFT_1889095 [Lactarius pseudohatsudake]